jgi:hypothetical protein
VDDRNDEYHRMEKSHHSDHFSPLFSIEIYRFLCKKTGTDRKVIIIDNIYNQFVAGNKPAKRIFGISDAELIELFHENHN